MFVRGFVHHEEPSITQIFKKNNMIKTIGLSILSVSKWSISLTCSLSLTLPGGKTPGIYK